MNHQPSPDSSILGVLCDHRTTAHNPMPLADVARLGGLIQPLDEHQARALLDAVARHRLEPLYRVALSLERATLCVTGSLQRMRGRLERTTTKTAASARSVDLPPVLLAALKRHREAQERERQQAGDRWRESGLVFTTNIGTRSSRATWSATSRPRSRKPASPDHSLSRPTALLRHTAHRAGGASARRDGDLAPQPDQHDDEHLRPCPARSPARRDSEDRGAVQREWHRTAGLVKAWGL
jgi:hypothetical protein